MYFSSSGLTGALRPEVCGKVGGVVELACNFPTSKHVGDASAAPLRVVEWVRQGLDSPVLMKFGSYKPRIHPDYEGERWVMMFYNVWCLKYWNPFSVDSSLVE